MQPLPSPCPNLPEAHFQQEGGAAPGCSDDRGTKHIGFLSTWRASASQTPMEHLLWPGPRLGAEHWRRDRLWPHPRL